MLFSFRHDCGCELTFRQHGDNIKFDQRFACRQHKDKPRFQIPRSGSDFVSYTLECGCAYLRDTRVFTCPSCRSLSSPPVQETCGNCGKDLSNLPPAVTHVCDLASAPDSGVPDNHAYHAARKPSIMAIAICALCGQKCLPDGTCHCGATPVGLRTKVNVQPTASFADWLDYMTAELRKLGVTMERIHDMLKYPRALLTAPLPVTHCVTEPVTFTEEERSTLSALVEIAYNKKLSARRGIVSIPKASRSSSWAQHLAMADNELAALTAVRDKVKKL